jgi:hypothetical protein
LESRKAKQVLIEAFMGKLYTSKWTKSFLLKKNHQYFRSSFSIVSGQVEYQLSKVDIQTSPSWTLYFPLGSNNWKAHPRSHPKESGHHISKWVNIIFNWFTRRIQGCTHHCRYVFGRYWQWSQNIVWQGESWNLCGIGFILGNWFVCRYTRVDSSPPLNIGEVNSTPIRQI